MPSVPNSIPITILAGQSNANIGMIGQAIFNRVADTGGMIIHSAVNGSPLSDRMDTGTGDWSTSSGAGAGELLQSLYDQIEAILDPSSPTHVPGAYLANVIWVQGEADSWSKTSADNYFSNLAALHDDMTDRFGTHDLILSGLSDAPHRNRTFSDNNAVNWDAVQAAQRALAADRATISLVNPDDVADRSGFSDADMFMSDFIHYDPVSGFAETLGDALALAAMPASSAFSSAGGPGIHYSCGTNLSDRLEIEAVGYGQVFASWGYDSVTLTDRAEGVQLLAVAPANSRVLSNDGSPLLIIDLVSVEQITLTDGDDRARLGAGITTIDTLDGDDRVDGSEYEELILLGEGYDTAQGGRGNDVIYGGGWVDMLYGGRDDDTLHGDSGADRIGGASGNDRLDGGYGNDILTGGSGHDRFEFYVLSGSDRIQDFENGIDLIMIDDVSYSDLRITSAGNNTEIRYADDMITLVDVKSWKISADDFILT